MFLDTVKTAKGVFYLILAWKAEYLDISSQWLHLASTKPNYIYC